MWMGRLLSCPACISFWVKKSVGDSVFAKKEFLTMIFLTYIDYT
jgi:hypothetical protein